MNVSDNSTPRWNEVNHGDAAGGSPPICWKLGGWTVAGFYWLSWLVAAVLLIFPGWKMMPAGYVPLAFGLFSALGLVRWARRRSVAAWERLPVWGAVAAVVVFQAVLILLIRPEPRFDALYVLREAQELARSGRMSPLTYYPPLQIWYYALWFKLLGARVLVAQLSNLLWVGMIVWAVYLLGRECCGKAVGVAAAYAVAFYPTFLFYVLVTPYYFYPYTFFMVLGAAWLLRSRKTGGQSAAALAGVSGALGALAKPVLLVAPVVALVFYCLTTRWGRALRLWLWFVAAFALTLMPWTTRNYRVFGSLVPVCTSGGFVLYSANNPQSNGLYSPLPDEARPASAQEMLQVSRDYARRALQFMAGSPGAFVTLAARKFLHTWGNEATYAELINLHGQQVVWLDMVVSFLAQWGWSVLVTLWVVGSRWDGRSQPRHPVKLLIALLVGVHVIVYLIFEGGARHHLPIVPLIVISVMRGLLTREDGYATA